MSTISKMKLRCCKIVPLFFGKTRRCWPQTWDNAKELIDCIIECEKNIYAGLPTDLIIVNMTNNVESIKYLNSLDNISTRSGKIKIVQKGNDFGISFGAFNLAFELFRKDYDYWFFLEDDQITTLSNYFIQYIDHLNSKDDLAFVAMIGITNAFEGSHAQSGAGCTHVKYLEELCEINNGQLPFCSMAGLPVGLGDDMPEKEAGKTRNNYWKNHILEGEIAFTNSYISKLNYRIEKFRGKKTYMRWISGNSEEGDFKEWGRSDFIHDRPYEYM